MFTNPSLCIAAASECHASAPGNSQKFHFVYFEVLISQVEAGGWDIKDPKYFNMDLHIKNMWSALNGEGIWKHIIR